MDEHTISPAGDPFHAAPRDDTVEAHYASLERLQAPHACIEGVVYIGRVVLGEDGDEVEVVDHVPCWRCADNAGDVHR